MKPSEGEPQVTDPATILERLGGSPTEKPRKPQTPEEILAHLQGEKPADPVDPDGFEEIKQTGRFFRSLLENQPPGK